MLSTEETKIRVANMVSRSLFVGGMAVVADGLYLYTCTNLVSYLYSFALYHKCMHFDIFCILLSRNVPSIHQSESIKAVNIALASGMHYM